MNEESSHHPILTDAKRLEMQRRRHRFQRKRSTSIASINGGGGLDSSTYSQSSVGSAYSTTSRSVSAASNRARQIARAKEKAGRMRKHRSTGFIARQGYSSVDPTTNALDISKRSTDAPTRNNVTKTRPPTTPPLDISLSTDMPNTTVNSSRALSSKTKMELSKEGLALIDKHKNLIDALKFEKEISILTKEISSVRSTTVENKPSPAQKVLKPKEQLENFAIYGPTTVAKKAIEIDKENFGSFNNKKREDDDGLFCTGCLFTNLLL